MLSLLLLLLLLLLFTVILIAIWTDYLLPIIWFWDRYTRRTNFIAINIIFLNRHILDSWSQSYISAVILRTGADFIIGRSSKYEQDLLLLLLLTTLSLCKTAISTYVSDYCVLMFYVNCFQGWFLVWALRIICSSLVKLVSFMNVIHMK